MRLRAVGLKIFLLGNISKKWHFLLKIDQEDASTGFVVC